MACEDPTLLIGARPISDAEPREAGTGGGRVTRFPDPTGSVDVDVDVDVDIDRDANVGGGVGEGEPEPEDLEPVADAGPRAPVRRPDASGFPMDDGIEADAGGADRGDGFDRGPGDGPDRGPGEDPWRPAPETRPRFAYRCRSDYECSRFRGVCDRGWCVQCRSWMDCPAYSTCSADRVCVRRPPPPGNGG